MGYEPFGGLSGDMNPPSAAGNETGNAASPDPGPNGDQEGVAGSSSESQGQTQSEQEPTEEQPIQTENPQEQVEEPQTQTEEPQTSPSGAVQITVVAGDVAYTIADKLFNAGAITDKQAFLSDTMAQGADSKMKQGTFTIPANSSHSDIISILTQ